LPRRGRTNPCRDCPTAVPGQNTHPHLADNRLNAEFLDDPRRQSRGRIGQGRKQCFRQCGLQLGIELLGAHPGWNPGLIGLFGCL
jgi:hypothetical protein